MHSEAITFSVAKINQHDILIYQNGETLVPMKPICDAIGVDFASQFTKAKNDEILSSVVVLSTTTGKDGKRYEMTCLPLRFVFGWLFSINPKNVSEEARQAIIKYKMECYDALFDYFTGARKFLEVKERATEELTTKLKEANKNFYEAKKLKRQAENELFDMAHFSYQNYLENGRQMLLPFADAEVSEEEE